MTKYLVLYTADIDAEEQMQQSEEEGAAEMKAWMTWAESVGNALVEFGLPLGNGMVVTAEGSRPAQSPIAGYSILQAANAQSAAALLMGHPHLKLGAIELHETISLPGM